VSAPDLTNGERLQVLIGVLRVDGALDEARLGQLTALAEGIREDERRSKTRYGALKGVRRCLREGELAEVLADVERAL